ncbi:MAG: hypothetical protein LBG14_06035 [Treponema sp.]|jgi:hypothetical protein|nr:hypothetical protein [Treponema sp.]
MKAAGQTHGWILPLCLGLVAAVSPLSAGGARDGGLALADKLIADRQYDEAIRILTAYTEENPEKFSHAQKRLRKIILLRDSYNTLTSELLDVLTTDPDNSEKILDLTGRLEAIEPAKGMALQFIAHVRELAVFGHNRRLLAQIMVEARGLLDQGDYVAAMRRYAGGLELYRDEFFSADHEESVEAWVRLYLRTLASSIEDFAVLFAPFRNAAAGINQVAFTGGEDGLTRLRDYYARLSPLLERFIMLENAMAKAGNYFDEQLALLRQEDPGLGDRNYLAFASRVVRGRWNADIQEGLLGSVAKLWTSALAPFDDHLENAAETAYRNARAAQEGLNFPQARRQFELAAGYCALAMDYLDDWRRFYGGQNFQTYEYFDHTVIVFKAEEYLQYYSMNLASTSQMETGPLLDQYNRLASMKSTALEAWQQGRMDAQTAIARESEARSAYHDLAVKVEAVLDRLNAGGDALLEGRYELTGRREHFVPMANALALFENMDANIFILENSAAIREYTVANRDLQGRVAEWKTMFAEGYRFFTGNSQSNAEGEYAARYPREALELFTRIDRESAQGLAEGRALIARYEGESLRFFREPRIAALYNGARSMAGEIEELRIRTLALEQTARTQAAQAEALEQEGDRLYREAQSALAQGNFDTARDRALRSGERYDASLEIQESAALRRVRDTSLIDLGAEITRLENEAVVREVRNLVNSARDSYFEGNFETAEEYLVRAMNRWQRINLEDDPEVSYWLTVVRGAVSLRAGRVIPPTAPLYQEMSQLLSDARKNFDDGIRLIGGNRRAEGLERFAEARKKTREVRLMFPVNQEASLLDLRMDQVIDPAAFNASFQRRLNEAVAGARQNSVESFADLQNLSEINPAYPGIRGLVVQAEIDMGYRPAPPDPRSLARSNELTAAARGIVDRNVRSQFPVALEQLNQALALNPSNSQAMSLKDRVQTEMGGGGSVVLNSSAEREYQRAVQALQQGNTLVAMTIVRQLLQNAEHRNSRRILDLQRRIESIL